MTEIEPAISSAEAARYLGVSLATMATWRNRGTGPPCAYSGEKPVYRLSELRAWQDSCTRLMAQKRAERVAEAAQNGGRRRGRPRTGVGLLGGRSEVVSS
jgi:hypothetical protein